MTQPNNVQTTYGSVFVTQPIVENDQLATKLYVDDSKASAISESKGYTDQEISSLVAGAPEALNTLKELADALGSGDIATSITQQITNVKSDLTDESNARSAAITDVYIALSTQASSTSNSLALVMDEVGVVQSNLDSTQVSLQGAIDDLVTRSDNNEANDVLASDRIDGVEVVLDEKFDKSGGDLTGSVKVPETHYLYIGNNWRLAAVGNSMEFQFSSTPEIEDTFVHGVPLVFSE